MSYIKKHWNGELPLSTSFWVNVVLLNIGLKLFVKWFNGSSPVENPVLASQLSIIIFITSLVILYPWQVIGLWRSANNHIKETKKNGWANTAKVIIFIGAFGTLANINNSLPLYKDLYQLGFKSDPYANYKIEITDDGLNIHLKGTLGFGISNDVNDLLIKHPKVKGIILDSIGGWIYEGRKLSQLILKNKLNTYSVKGCYSACGTAFISGKKRYLSEGANLAFHQYSSSLKHAKSSMDMNKEQKKDLKIYQNQKIKQSFIDKLFLAKHDDLWYPTINEMLNANVIHATVNSSSLIPADYNNLSIEDVIKAIDKISLYKVIKKYEPEMYKNIIASFDTQLKNGASMVQIQQAAVKQLEPLASKYLPLSSDKALITFAHEITKVLTKFDSLEPVFCMKYLFPEQYGALNIAKYLTREEMMSVNDALSFMVSESFESKRKKVDTKQAEMLFEKLVPQLGDDVKYLDGPPLKNKAEYSKACNTFIKLYKLILLNETEVAGNGLRYIFS